MRTAPVQGGPPIPWPLHVEAWAAYVQKYGHGQTAERLAERGGFHVDEMDEFVPGWRDRHAAIVDMVEAAVVKARAWQREECARKLRKVASLLGVGVERDTLYQAAEIVTHGEK